MCVGNSSLVNGQCVCDAGYEQTSGAEGPQCQKKNDCASLAGKSYGELRWKSDFEVDAEGYHYVCGVWEDAGQGKCIVKAGGGINIKFQDGDGVWWTAGEGRFTGEIASTCSGDGSSSSDGNVAGPDSGSDKNPCPNGYPGTVNGTDVCVPHQGQNGIEGVDTKKETDKDGNTKETKTETKCKDGVCTTTTTTTTTNTTTNTTTTETTTTTSSASETCAKNPGAAVCKAMGKDQGVLDGLRQFCKENPTIGMCAKAGGSGNGNGNGDGDGDGDGDEDGNSFSGNCEAGFVAVSEDAVLNAMAKEQHIRNCKFFDEKPEPTDDTNDADEMRAKGKSGVDQTNDLPEGLRKSFEISGADFDTTSVIGAQSCFTDKNVSVFGKTIAIPLSIVCPWLSIIGDLLMVVGWILAARIVIRG